MTSLKTSIKTITYLSDIGCLEIQGASLASMNPAHMAECYHQIAMQGNLGGETPLEKVTPVAVQGDSGGQQ